IRLARSVHRRATERSDEFAPSNAHLPSHARELIKAELHRRRAAEEGDELAPPHSITSSARRRTTSGTWRPSAFAVFMLSTVSYLVGACPGRSAGFCPLSMRSTYPAARRCGSIASAP